MTMYSCEKNCSGFYIEYLVKDECERACFDLEEALLGLEGALLRFKGALLHSFAKKLGAMAPLLPRLLWPCQLEFN